jgi:hypothetical protein
MKRLLLLCLLVFGCQKAKEQVETSPQVSDPKQWQASEKTTEPKLVQGVKNVGLETDFFVASDEQLEAAFPAWVRPKPKQKVDGTWAPSRPFPDLGKSPNAIYKAEMAAMKKLPHAQFKGIDPVKLGLLQSIVGGGEGEIGIEDRPALLANPGKDDSLDEWMNPLNQALIQGLAGLTKEKLKTAAKRWSETDELQGWSTKDAAEVIERLSDLAKRANEEKKNMYLWMRL